MRRMPSWSQKIEARTFPADFCTQNFLGRGEPLCRHSIDCCFASGSWRYKQVSSMVTNRAWQEIIWIAPKKFQNLLRRLAPLTFLILFQAFHETHFAESFRMSNSSWMMGPTRSSEMPSCSAMDLAEIRRSSKISSWIWSITSGVVTVLGRPGRGASQVEISPRLNWATQFLTVAYDGARSPNVSVRMAWISFSALPCGREGGGLDDSSSLDVVEIARVAWHASFQRL